MINLSNQGEKPKAFLFPGQGSQHLDMFSGYTGEGPITKKILKTAKNVLNFDITKVFLNSTEEDLQKNHIAQPAIFLHSLVIQRRTANQLPQAFAGHSLGEYTALVANENISLEDGIYLVYQRALAMEQVCKEMPPSGMLAVIDGDQMQIQKVCDAIPDLYIANYNHPKQVVLSGTEKGIKKAIEELTKCGIRKLIQLKVEGAFHSPFMEPVQAKLANLIGKISFQEGKKIPIYQNVSGKPITNLKKLKENLIKQVSKPVLWMQTIQNMIQDGFKHYEIYGTGKALSNIVKKINPTVAIKLLA